MSGDFMESSRPYSPLPTKTSMRLLHLQRGIDKESSRIRCTLSVHELDKAPEYEALSYVWGDPEPSEEISLDGHPLNIGTNLAAALRQLRPLRYRIRDRFHFHASKSKKKAKMWDVLQSRYDFVQWIDPDSRVEGPSERIIWADALCIDQSNLEEKSHQVKEMAQIYKTAKRVLIWLGADQGADVNHVIKALPLLHTLKEDSDTSRARNNVPMKQRFDAELARYPERDSTQWNSFAWVFDWEWFERLWVIQEACMASSALVIIGDVQLQWDVIGDSAWWIFYRQMSHEMYSYKRDGMGPEVSRRTFERMGLAANIQTIKRARDNLDIICASSVFRCKLPIDRVYGVLGLMTGISIEPDYGLPPAEVYCSVTRQTIEIRRDLLILGKVDHEASILSNPSWVPAWQAKLYHMPMNDRTASGVHHTSLNQPLELLPDDDPKCLVTRGIPVSKITGASDVLDFSGPYVNGVLMLQRAMEFLHFHLSSDKIFLTGPYEPEHTDLVLLELLTAGRWSFTHDVTQEQISDYAKVLRKWLEIAHRAHLKDHTKVQLDIKDRFAEHILGSISQFCLDRRVFSLKEGYLGLGPAAMEVGDEVVILFGGMTPFVVRPVPMQDDQCKEYRSYYFVGECYVHGIMHGEAVEAWRKSGSDAVFYKLV
ncbi:heterokaryon incompatibility protein-domain-containing protein [Cadophora sp. MPI-SDFR-AT-0126]|nr:heterokaryon incompatibility protein-domain-containing protein [Leotiomycetes sp. MPI-SDFR-AT-0126]